MEIRHDAMKRAKGWSVITLQLKILLIAFLGVTSYSNSSENLIDHVTKISAYLLSRKQQ